MRLPRIFRVLVIILGMRSEKMILKNSLVVLFWYLSRSTTMPKWNWLDMLIGGGETVISTISVSFSYNIIFIVCILPTFFMHLKRTTMSPMLSKSLSPRPTNHRYLHWASRWDLKVCSKADYKGWRKARSCWWAWTWSGWWARSSIRSERSY